MIGRCLDCDHGTHNEEGKRLCSVFQARHGYPPSYLEPERVVPDPLETAVQELNRRTSLVLQEQTKLLVREEVQAALKTIAPSRQDDPYWQGRRDGAERFSEKERELVAAQEALAEVRGQLQEVQAKEREHQKEIAALKSGVIDCWHCRDVLEPGPFHCEKCPPFNQCDDSECKEEGCQEQLKCSKCGARSPSDVDDLGHCKTCERFVG
jgi:hypothetical protein